MNQNEQRPTGKGWGAKQTENQPVSDHTLNESTQISPAQNGNGKPQLPIGRWASEVKPEDIDWLWPLYVARGVVTIIEGDPTVGKTPALIDLASRITRGREWPDGSPGVSGSVVILNAEDGEGVLTRPRLDAAGADVSRVLVFDGWLGEGDDKRFMSLPNDMKLIEDTMKQTRAALLVVDTLNAFLANSGIDVKSDTDVRRVLMEFKRLAERYNIAVLIVRHLTKDSKNTNPLYRGAGSIAFLAASRAVLLVGFDPTDEEPNPDHRRRVMAPSRCLSERAPSLAFNTVQRTGDKQPHVEWDGTTDLTAQDLLTPVEKPRGRPGDARARARDFLLRYLKDGPRAHADVIDAAAAEGIKESTLDRAKNEAGVVSYKDKTSFDGGWVWTLQSRN